MPSLIVFFQHSSEFALHISVLLVACACAVHLAQLHKQRFCTILDSSFVSFEHRICAAAPVADVISQWTPGFLDPTESDRPGWRPSCPSEGCYCRSRYVTFIAAGWFRTKVHPKSNI
jgi:hypothetical protein